MDKTHVLSVYKFDDVEKYTSMKDTYEEPKLEPYKEKEHLKSWLMDPLARDQWVVTQGDDVNIFWNNKTEKPELTHSREVCNFGMTSRYPFKHLLTSNNFIKTFSTGPIPTSTGLLMDLTSPPSTNKVSLFGEDLLGKKSTVSFIPMSDSSISLLRNVILLLGLPNLLLLKMKNT